MSRVHKLLIRKQIILPEVKLAFMGLIRCDLNTVIAVQTVPGGLLLVGARIICAAPEKDFRMSKAALEDKGKYFIPFDALRIKDIRNTVSQ
uniref:TATA box-binding protein-like protein 2 n=1 Tax=Ascaris lumbricoides TaxID=6252 RepID=A0A0M3I9C6_ASCLU